MAVLFFYKGKDNPSLEISTYILNERSKEALEKKLNIYFKGSEYLKRRFLGYEKINVSKLFILD